MSYFLIFILSIAFIELFLRFKVFHDARSILDFSKEGLSALTRSEMNDKEKELLARRISKELFRSTFKIAIKLLFVFFVLYAIYCIIKFLSYELAESLIDGLASPVFLLIVTVASIIYAKIRTSIQKNYSAIDRLLHYLAFSTSFVQKALFELENDMFKRQIEKVESKKEVFISGLPRSGTTLLLEFLYDTNEFVTFSYRHMPFILSPLLWMRFSKFFQQSGSRIERAHGDGMEVSFDSPEAFEEILWLYGLKDKYVLENMLLTLSPKDIKKESLEVLKKTINKLLLNDSDDTSEQLRYLSKNNANISRIELILEQFPTSKIIIPFRNPLSHVSSLTKQHKQFLKLHSEDNFSKKYMEWLGHYDFGKNFKPINFDNWLINIDTQSYEDNTFWLNYWIAAYTHVLDHKSDNVYLVDFDQLLIDGQTTLQTIADIISIKNADQFVSLSSKLRLPTSKPLESCDFPSDVLRSAINIHSSLKESAIQ